VRFAAITLAVLCLAGCAPRINVVPVMVDPDRYANLTCEEMKTELTSLNSKLREANYKFQESTELYTWLPIFKDNVSEASDKVQQYQGEMNALETAMSRKEC